MWTISHSGEMESLQQEAHARRPFTFKCYLLQLRLPLWQAPTPRWQMVQGCHRSFSLLPTRTLPQLRAPSPTPEPMFSIWFWWL